jgi:23S rRNA pseudouridine1911/1915/1917 synthase
MPDGFEILLEDGPLLVINKPAGIATQAPPQFDSLEVRIRRFLAERNNEPGAYLGVPHRLDRPVSGVMLFATKRRAAFKLSRQFERRTIDKLYWACVEGAVDPPEGTWTDHLWKVYGQPRAQVVEASHPGAQQAILHYRTLSQSEHGTTLEIKLETGRTHQIRVQTASRGHAVIGDHLYGSQIPFGEPTDDERSRTIALHARSISFNHPTTGERLTLIAPAPPTWPPM